MRFLTTWLFLLLTILCLFSAPANGQAPQTNDQFNLWGGFSFNSMKFLGKTQNAQTQIFGIGYQRHMREYSNRRTLWYTVDVIPYLHFYYPKRDESNRMVKRSGFGLSPVGFSMTQQTDGPITPFLQTTGGIIYMESNFPTDRARRLNYTFDITLGANINLNAFSAISVGYKFHHISNAETGNENPGLDSNFLFLTLSIH